MILQKEVWDHLLLAEEIRLVSQSQPNIALQSQSTSSPNISSDKWIIDSGATNNMSHHLSFFCFVIT